MGKEKDKHLKDININMVLVWALFSIQISLINEMAKHIWDQPFLNFKYTGNVWQKGACFAKKKLIFCLFFTLEQFYKCHIGRKSKGNRERDREKMDAPWCIILSWLDWWQFQCIKVVYLYHHHHCWWWYTQTSNVKNTNWSTSASIFF